MHLFKNQQGVYTVEFAIVGGLVLLLIFGIFEISRAFWVKSILTEATRRGARIAVVCPINHSAIKNLAVLDDASGDGVSPFLNNFSTVNISVEYLDDSGNTTANYPDIDFVRVSINNYQHRLLIPFIPADVATLQMPPLSTTLPAESLGYIPDTGIRQCFGS